MINYLELFLNEISPGDIPEISQEDDQNFVTTNSNLINPNKKIKNNNNNNNIKQQTPSNINIKQSVQQPQNNQIDQDQLDQTEIQEVEPIELGKVYFLKKIYSRLVSISNILQYINDPKYNELRIRVQEALEMFHMIVNSFDQYYDRVDEINTSYQKFLIACSKELESLSRKRD